MELKLGRKYYSHDLECELEFVGYFDNGDLWFHDHEKFSHIMQKSDVYLLEPVVMDVVDELKTYGR